jgi:hypothetical protein
MSALVNSSLMDIEGAGIVVGSSGITGEGAGLMSSCSQFEIPAVLFSEFVVVGGSH